jgi:hypothetical protein
LSGTDGKSLTHRKPKAANMISRYITIPWEKRSVLRYPDACLGYRGIEPSHSNSFIPLKVSNNRQLTKGEKAYTKELMGRRVVIEHINGKIKHLDVWHILTGDITTIGIL